MRYLIFGDVHGNLPALEKLLEIEKCNYDYIVSHGDVVNYGPWSNECVELLNVIPNTTTLKGNHEDNFLRGSYSGKNEVAKAFFEFCYPRFSEFGLIEEYEKELQLKNFKIEHTIGNGYIFPDSNLAEIGFNGNYIIGHSHYQFDRMEGSRRLINTGSIGQNRKYINLAEYVILDQDKNLVELKSFIYDIDTVIDKMTAEKYPQICLDYYKNKKRK
ncbi:MAG TPA: metallophosphoesterase family protein [Salinimicrobium sp.]|nr:metallophosphoesterase family protein [Salinimicrobium sp.]